MTDKLNWGYEKHDFSAIKETLVKYHPIENPHQYTKENIEDFKGFKDIQEIIQDNFITAKNYKKRWAHFKKFLEQELKKSVRETMHISYPCYSGIITLQEETHNNLTYTKELHFFISLLGPYYTIMGMDKCSVRLQQITRTLDGGEELRNRPFHADLAVTVSPYLEFEEPFLQLQRNILEYFPGLMFIPYNINRIKIEGSTLLYRDDEPLVKHSVFNALFQSGNLFQSNFFEPETRGDTHFGFDEWLIIKKPDKSRVKEIKEGLATRSLNAKAGISVHKVWKYQAAVRIPSGFRGMMAVPFIVLDLTDERTAIIVSREDEEPETSEYSIADNEIIIDIYRHAVAGFRIERLDESGLKLILNMNFHNGERTIKGDILEMTYEIYR